MAGIDENGLTIKRLREILDDAEAALATVTDPDTGESLVLDLDADDGPLVQVEQINADALATVWEILQLVYNQFDPALATGAPLRGLAQLNGIRARIGTNSTVTLLASGTPGTPIPKEARITAAGEDAPIFITTDAATIGVGGTVLIPATAETVGPVAALAGTLTVITEPAAGWATVTNAADAELGVTTETDPELRTRRDQSTAAPGVGPVEASRANLLQIEGVTFARLYINNDLVTDARGIPAKTLASVVVGGDDEQIAGVLFLRNAGGVRYFGNTAFEFEDLQGEPHLINWIRPDEIDISIEVDITVTDDRAFPATGAADIQAAILAYAMSGRGGLNISEGFESAGFVPGQEIATSRLYTPVNSVPGHKVTRLETGTGGPLTAADIAIAFDEQGAFDISRITVTVA
ncbi:MAG: baseplate J/gp47 family protein [Rhodobacteraceae bacterium]|nr:baseplate J/gp47 family protein [Paracoccaceae bacterium]